jgi:hypothetical protein
MSQYVLQRIQAIQTELETLKKIVTNQFQSARKTTKIKGLWQEAIVTEDDLIEAKQAVFRDGINREQQI